MSPFRRLEGIRRRAFGGGSGGHTPNKPAPTAEQVSRQMSNWRTGQWACIESKTLAAEKGIAFHSLWSDRIHKSLSVQILHGEHGPIARVTGLGEFGDPKEDIRRHRQKSAAESIVKNFLEELAPGYNWEIKFED